ncbi:hypothetical protein BaRGS_00036769 [Batillaria attramentaria]|uniref:Uncharacterized protein n=1 Tax=Batillaria attramentaria TaxID=370345 RepID=A0ABD0JAT5_9CAEN
MQDDGHGIDCQHAGYRAFREDEILDMERADHSIQPFNRRQTQDDVRASLGHQQTGKGCEVRREDTVRELGERNFHDLLPGFFHRAGENVKRLTQV